MSDYDDELIGQLQGLEINLIWYGPDDGEKYFELLNTRFPVTGTKIAWDSFSSKCKKSAKYTTLADFSEFIQEIKRSCSHWGGGEDSIIYIGDSLTENAYELRFSQLDNFFQLINEIPQHHYFLNKNGDWCLCLDMTGYLDFSFAPNL